MAKIVIDARESGTSTGRYIDKLIEHMYKIGTPHNIVILSKKQRLDFMQKIAPSFSVVETPYAEFGFGEQWGFKKQIESLKPDLVHFGMVQQPLLYRGRVVTTMHDLITVRFRNPSKNILVFTAKQQVYKVVNKLAARKSRFVITPTQFVKDDVVQYTGVSPAKVVVTLEAADKIMGPSEKVGELEGKKFIMYVGRPLPHKNLRRLMQAFQQLQIKRPELYLVLAGKKDALYEQHEAWAKQNGLKNVIFTGFISDGQLKWLYRHTACYVFPSLSEGFGLPGLEAMAHGAPVASSNYTCLPEVHGDATAYFDPKNVKSIGECLEKVIYDETFRKKLIDLGEKKYKEYSWDRMAIQTLNVYDRALKA